MSTGIRRIEKVAPRAKAIGPLSDAKIMALRPATSGQIEYPDSMVPGLRIRIGTTGSRRSCYTSGLQAGTATSRSDDLVSG